MTIYMFSKEDSKDITKFTSLTDAAETLEVPEHKIQRVLDGYLDDIDGFKFMYKPEATKGFDTTKVSYHQEQKNRFFYASNELCTWEECKVLYKDDAQIPRKSVRISDGIRMLRNGFTAIPF